MLSRLLSNCFIHSLPALLGYSSAVQGFGPLSDVKMIMVLSYSSSIFEEINDATDVVIHVVYQSGIRLHGPRFQGLFIVIAQ